MGLTLEEIKKIQTIGRIFGGEESLLQFFFHQKGPYLRYTPEDTIRFAQDFNSNDFMLVKIALDFMRPEGSVLLKDIFNLDEKYFINAFNGFLYFKEIPIDLDDIC